VLRQAIVVLRAVSRAGLPVLLATLIVAVICIFGEPLFGTNDDVGIAMVGAGFGEAAHPEAHLVWCHYGYGLVLAALSKLVGPNAHGWVTIAAIWLCLVLVIRVILRAQKAILRWSLFLLCLGAIFLKALLSAEFTITAGVLFGAAIASWLAEQTQNKKSFVTMTAIILALIFSYLIRPECYSLGLIIILPALLFLCWRRKRLISSNTLMGLGLAGIFVLGAITDKLAYSTSPDWCHVPEYNDLRAQFDDFDRVPWRADAPEYNAVGWTFNDYCMFGSLYSKNPIYSLQNVSFLVQRLGVPRRISAIPQIRDWFSYPFTDWPLLLNLIGQLAVFILLKQDQRFVGFLFLVGEIVGITLAAMIGRQVVQGSQIWYAASATTLMCLCASLILTRHPKESLVWNAGSFLTGLLGIVAMSVVLWRHLEEVRKAGVYREWVNQNIDYFKGNVVVWSVGLRWEWLVTPTRIYPPFPELKIGAIDDLNCMPVETDMLKTLGIDDLAKALCTDPTMKLICRKELILILTRFGEEHYQVSPVFKEAADCGGWAGIYTLDHAANSPIP
jgi:hypothetical protein